MKLGRRIGGQGQVTRVRNLGVVRCGRATGRRGGGSVRLQRRGGLCRASYGAQEERGPMERQGQQQVPSSFSSPPSSGGSVSRGSGEAWKDPVMRAAEKVARLELSLTLRKLYRNLLRAETLLKFPCPVYQPEEEEMMMASSVEEEGSTLDAVEREAADRERERKIDEAVDYVAELELTADELRMILSTLKNQVEDFPLIFPDQDPQKLIGDMRDYVKSMYKRLVDRLTEELPHLPFPSVGAAQAEIESRNAAFRGTSLPLGALGPELGGYVSDQEGDFGDIDQKPRNLKKKAERFVSRNLQPAVARVRETSSQGFIEGFQQSATWAQDLWKRLNGATNESDVDSASDILSLPFPKPEGKDAQAIEYLHKKIVDLEAKLQEASKVRENRVRKTDIPSRAKVAAELRQLDEQVTIVSRELAVRTLQLEMESIYECLESEALDILGEPAATIVGSGGSTQLDLALSRRGSTDEIALLCAEFKGLATSLAVLAAASEPEEILFIDDAELAALATEIPDLRIRLGLGDDIVFGSSGFSFSKVQFQVRQAVNKVKEGVLFGGRGVRLLGGDVAAAGRLFWRALLGGTLKPREVAALRRTARDLLTFIPFIIILILPLTPVGHVLIFGFIQRYFPGFFPSQFTSRRQDLMIKYEELKRQLEQAQIQAEAENDEMEFRKMAAAAEAILSQKNGTAMFAGQDAMQESSSSSSDVMESNEDDLPGPAAEAVKELEKKLAAAADSSYTEVDDSETED